MSANEGDVRRAIEAGYPAGTVIPSEVDNDDENDHELRVAFDFDGVIADDEAEAVYKRNENLAEFLEHETSKAQIPHKPGPLADLFRKLSFLQKIEATREKNYLDVLLSDFPDNALVMDIGCGTGRPMAEYVISKGHRVLGIDQAEKLIQLARARFPDEQWVLSSIEQHQFSDDFHAAIIWDLLFHIDRSMHATILHRVVEHLPKSGKIILTVDGSAHPPFTDHMFGQEFFYDSNTPEETTRMLHGLGCRIVIGEFMNLPTIGRDKGRYAIVAQKT
ncbi:Methyltransferase domain-containing protein [Nitrosomonas sp. Nm132]|nr:Methyltransferase domain-containing protein [Nitrosomonas sp. Nm132]